MITHVEGCIGELLDCHSLHSDQGLFYFAVLLDQTVDVLGFVGCLVFQLPILLL